MTAAAAYPSPDLPMIGPRVDLPEMPDDARAIRQCIAHAWKAYRGDWKGQLPLKVDRGDPDDNVLVNRCAPIVDKGISFLFGEMPTIEVKGPNGKGAAPKEAQDALIAALGDEDELATTLTMAAMNGGVSGHSFVKLCPPQPDSDDPDGDADDYPRIVVQDPQNYWVVTDPDDVNCVLQYVCEYDYSPRPGMTGTKRVVTARENATAKHWTVTTYVRERATITGAPAGIVALGDSGASVGGSWMQVAEEDWAYAWSPIHDCMNLPNPNEYWGVPDITPDLIHLNAVLNYVESNINKIGRLHGTPWPFVTGVHARELEQAQGGPGKITAIPSDEAKPGAIQWAGDIANLMAFAGSVRGDMDEQSRVPAVALGRPEALPKGNISGVALELMFQPLLEKTRLKRRLYGRLLCALCRHILEMLNAEWRDLTISLTWPSLMPDDDQGAAQVALAANQVGMSQHFIVSDVLGQDYDEEMTYRQKEAKDALKKATQGLGLPLPNGPSAPMGAPGYAQQPPAPNDLSQPGQQPGQPKAPPTNHPAAVRQRAAVKAVSNVMKAGG